MRKLDIRYVRIGLLVSAIALIVIGVLVGEHTSVLQKSIRICLECIGIG